MGEGAFQAVPAVPTLDAGLSSFARVYDRLLCGDFHTGADQRVAYQMEQAFPLVAQVLSAAREWRCRAVRFLAKQGVRQFLVLGGVPGKDAVHEVARRCDPDVRVVYVESDPFTAACVRRLVHEDSGVGVVCADPAIPATVLADSAVTRTLDWTRPVAIVACGLVEHLADADDPAGIIATYQDAMPVGSWLVFSHLSSQPAPGFRDQIDQAAEVLHKGTGQPWICRDAVAMDALLVGFHTAEPGIVAAQQWLPDAHDGVSCWLPLLAVAARIDPGPTMYGLAEQSMPRRPGRVPYTTAGAVNPQTPDPHQRYRIARYRRRNGQTQQQVADSAGFTREYVSMIENGRRAPGRRMLTRLATALGVDVSALTDTMPDAAEDDPGQAVTLVLNLPHVDAEIQQHNGVRRLVLTDGVLRVALQSQSHHHPKHLRDSVENIATVFRRYLSSRATLPLASPSSRDGRGSLHGQLNLTEGWDSAETNQEIAHDFGVA